MRKLFLYGMWSLMLFVIMGATQPAFHAPERSFSPYAGRVLIYRTNQDGKQVEVIRQEATGAIIEMRYLSVMHQAGKRKVQWRTEQVIRNQHKAEQLVRQVFPFVSLSEAHPEVFDKQGLAYFYRWYLSHNEIFPMVEVVFAADTQQVVGIRYYPQSPWRILSPGIDVIYANDGAYWTHSGSMPIHYGQGYCGVQASWCGPAWARHASSGSPTGKWYTPHAYGHTNLALWVFVPRPATGTARYYKQNGYVGQVIQTWYSDVWAAASWNFASPRYIQMTRQNGNIYWDEIRIFGGWQ